MLCMFLKILHAFLWWFLTADVSVHFSTVCSPPGGDFSDPVTSATLGIVQVGDSYECLSVTYDVYFCHLTLFK